MKNMHKSLRRITVALVAVIGAYGSVAAAAQPPIKLGLLTPLSGTYEPIGQQDKWGTELAVKEINASGGIDGRQIKVIIQDGQADPSVVARKAEELFQKDNVDFLVGVVNSGATLALSQIAERNKKLAATSVSLSDAITGSKCSPNMFRVNAPGDMQARGLAAWLKKAKPNARIFLLGPDYEMGRSTVASFEHAANELKFSLSGPLFPPLGEKDYTNFFGQIRQARPDVIYTSTAGNDTVRLFSQLHEYGLSQHIQLVGASVAVTAQNLKAMGKTAEGFVTVADYSITIDTPANHKFVSDFRAAYKTDPDMYGADAYGLVYLYKAAVEKAKSTATDAVRKAMEGMSWETPQGTKTMRAGDHQAQMPMYVLQIKNGGFHAISDVPAKDAQTPDTCTRF